MASSSCQLFLPVRIEDLEGEHFALVVNALVKSKPSRATLSKPGVLIQVVPYMLAWGKDWSSEITNKMFGFSLVTVHENITEVINSRVTQDFFIFDQLVLNLSLIHI